MPAIRIPKKQIIELIYQLSDKDRSEVLKEFIRNTSAGHRLFIKYSKKESG